MSLPWDNNSWEVAARIAADRTRRNATWMTGESRPDTPLPLRISETRPQILLLAVIVPETLVLRGERTQEGTIIEAVTAPWFEIIELLARDPNAAFELPPEKWEEIVAGAYHKAGFDKVTLTPRSGDHGRDIIESRRAWVRCGLLIK
jgi:hypothetical protein